jgi:hypothetical protein
VPQLHIPNVGRVDFAIFASPVCAENLVCIN